MTFTHDVEHSLATIVDLVNTDPRSAGEELLPGLAELDDFVHRHEVSEVGRLTREDLDGVHELRPRLRALFSTGDPAEAAALVARVIGTATVSPRLTDHDGYDWHLHYFAPGARLAGVPFAPSTGRPGPRRAYRAADSGSAITPGGLAPPGHSSQMITASR